jgi:uncharacterized membrane protein YfcA
MIGDVNSDSDRWALIALFVLGLFALAAIVALSFYDHVVPSEVSAIPGVVVGALAGAYYGHKRQDPPAV